MIQTCHIFCFFFIKVGNRKIKNIYIVRLSQIMAKMHLAYLNELRPLLGVKLIFLVIETCFINMLIKCILNSENRHI